MIIVRELLEFEVVEKQSTLYRVPQKCMPLFINNRTKDFYLASKFFSTLNNAYHNTYSRLSKFVEN